MSQRNPKAPDFKHKIDNTALWIDSKYTPTWVKDRLEDFNIERQGVYAVVNNFNLFFSRWFHLKKLVLRQRDRRSLCTYIHTYTYTYVHTHTRIHMYTHIHLYLCTHIHVYLCTYIHIYLCT